MEVFFDLHLAFVLLSCFWLSDFVTTRASYKFFSFSSFFIKFLSNIHSFVVSSWSVFFSSLARSIQLVFKFSKAAADKIFNILQTNIDFDNLCSPLNSNSLLFNSFHNLFSWAVCVDILLLGVHENEKNSVQILNNWSLDTASNCCFSSSYVSQADSLSIIF